MIHDVDQVLRSLIGGHALPGVITDIEFAAPTKDWAARRNSPTVNLYLYDIREDVSRRERGLVSVRNAEGRVVQRRQPPRWFRLSYLVTAWTARPEDEHRLLSAVLTLLLRHETLPQDELTGELSELGFELPLSVAVPPVESRSLADVWSALGGELKPSLDVVAVVPFPISPEYPAASPAEEMTVEVRGPGGIPVDRVTGSFRRNAR